MWTKGPRTGLRDDPTHADTVLIVATTGFGQESDRQCRNAGFNDHLVKPVAFDRPLALIQKVRKSG